MKMIDFLKMRTYSQKIILHCRGLENLTPDREKKGVETFKINDRIKFEFRPQFEYGELVGFSYVDIILFPNFIFTDGLHNGGSFSPAECRRTLSNVFESLRINENEFCDLEICSIEFAVNIIPHSDTKEIIQSIKFWKKQPFVRNRAEFSLITESSGTKHIKAYSKGIDDLERIKSGLVDINTFRFEVKQKKSKEIKYLILKTKDRKIKFTAENLFHISTYKRFQECLMNDLKLTLFIEKNLNKKMLTAKERAVIEDLSNPQRWITFLESKNKDKFGYERKKYEMILSKIPTLKKEVTELIQNEFNRWENLEIPPKKIVLKNNASNHTSKHTKSMN